MKQDLLTFIQKERVGVIATQLKDASPHGAVVHFAFNQESFEFLFITLSSTKKFELLHEEDEVKATFVMGFDEEEMKTLQMDGKVSVTESEEDKQIYLEKFSDRVEALKDHKLLVFKPNWWRYTDWHTEEGKKALMHDGEIVLFN